MATAVSPAQLGDPVAGTSAFRVCIWDTPRDRTSPRLVYDADLPAGGTCTGKPCWRVLRTKGSRGVRFRDRTGGNPGGVELLEVRARGSCKISWALVAGGLELPDLVRSGGASPGATRWGHRGDPQRRRARRAQPVRCARRHEHHHALQGNDQRPDEALQWWRHEAAPPELRLRTRGRHGLRRPRQLRKSRHRDAEPGSHGERGSEVHAVLRRCVGLHAVARDAAHGALSGPDGAHPARRVLPLRHDRARSRRADHRRGAARARLRDGAHRQVAPWPSPGLSSYPPGLRRLLRPALQQ